MKFALMSLFALSIVSAQAASLKHADYQLGKCDVSVREGLGKGTTEVRVDSRDVAQYGQIIIDKENSIVAINTCNSPMSGADQYPISSTGKVVNGNMILSSSCGGKWNAVDGKTELTVNTKSGKITAFKINFKVAKIGFPNGINSGPFKETLENFSCN